MVDLRLVDVASDSRYGEISNGYFEIKKSKFYSYIFSVSSEEQVTDIITKIKKDNKKARHIVYAYSFVDEKNVIHLKFSNDNEPQGTGVNSIISMLQKQEVINYLVVIVRYFGGSLLGAGVLLRSYLTSFKESYKNIKK